jgi:hypothetical protein
MKSLLWGSLQIKNFIVANAVDAILSAPKLRETKEKDFTKKKNYGKCPGYLQKIKKEIDEEYELVREMQLQEDRLQEESKFLLSEEERRELLSALKKKWEIVHREYQQITHAQKIDTVGLRRRKEE